MIVGYGICGAGEAERYMRKTLDNFKRLTDKTIICLNRATDAERRLIEEYGFLWVEDDREWGKHQWQIKQDFLEQHVSKLNPDWLIAMDMDEEFDPYLSRTALNNLIAGGHTAFHTWVVDLWDDGYAPNRCFWKVQIWKWNGDCQFAQKALHCGLAPFWAATTAAFAPYLLIHYGLQKKEDRQKKTARYELYDPNAQFIGKDYYNALRTGEKIAPYNVEDVHEMVAKEVSTYHQPVKKYVSPKIAKFVKLVRESDGKVLDIPEAHVGETIKRGGFHFFRKD